METQKISEPIPLSDYYNRLTAINQDAEIDLRNIMGQLTLDRMVYALRTRKRFNHKYGHNKLTAIFKQEDWYFQFQDGTDPFDASQFSLSELPLESKLILIDILQKL